MRCFKAFAAAACAVLIPGVADAECFVCDNEVSLTGEHARCFLDNTDRIARAIQKSEDGYLLIDLANCVGPLGQKKSWRSGIGQMKRPDLDEPGQTLPTAPVKSAYILDINRTECLKRHLGTREDALDPEVFVDLFKACSVE